jgi:predicted Zn-dependent peptidase
MWLAAWLGSALAADVPRALPFEIHERTLPNGLSAIVVPMATPGVASCFVWMDVGSRDEVDAGRTGFAHFFEHLMFYGTPTLGREAREREILRLGAEENAWTWFDETVYHATLSKDAVPRYLEMQADLFQHIASTRTRARYELLSRLDEPEAVAYTLGTVVRRTGTPSGLDRWLAAYDARTPDDVAAAVREVLVDARLSVVTLVPPPETQP